LAGRGGRRGSARVKVSVLQYYLETPHRTLEPPGHRQRDEACEFERDPQPTNKLFNSPIVGAVDYRHIMATLWVNVLDFFSAALDDAAQSYDRDELNALVSAAIGDVPDKHAQAVLHEHNWDDENGEFLEDPDIRALKNDLDLVAPKKRKHIGIKFCPECNNMLYPHENKDEKRLMYRCQVYGCGYVEAATSNCIYINRMAQDVDTLLLLNSDMASDPTLQHTSGRMEACPECDHDDAVFFQTLANRDVSGMRLYFVCTNPACGHAWVSKAYHSADAGAPPPEEEGV